MAATSTTTPAPPPPAWQQQQQPYVYFTILEEVFSSSSASSKDTEDTEVVLKAEVWEQLPDELQQLVLLRLPAGSQARLSGVCKRWKAVMESAAFREQSAEVAWTSRHATGSRTLIFSGTHAPRFSSGAAGAAGACTRVHKVHRVSLATFPPDMPPGVFAGHAQQQPQQQHESSKKVLLCPNEYQWTAHGGVVAVAVAADAGRALRVCVLDTAAAGGAEPWRELPRLRPPAACAKTWYHRSWEACLYDAVYDGRGRRWGYKMLVSWVRDEDAAAEVVATGEGEQADGGGGDGGGGNSNSLPVTSFYVYSSATGSWSATTAAALESPRPGAAESRRDLSHLVVGRDCISAKKRGVGWKWRATGKDEEEATEFSLRGNRVPAVLPAVLRLPGGMQQQGRTWPAVLQDARSSLFCVRSNCTIYKCTGPRWTEVASPPAQMWADMKILTRRRSAQQPQSSASAREKGKGFVTDVVLAACIIDPVIFLVVQLPYAACHILGYHVVRDAWEWVAQFHRRPLWHAQWHPPLFVRSPLAS